MSKPVWITRTEAARRLGTTLLAVDRLTEEGLLTVNVVTVCRQTPSVQSPTSHLGGNTLGERGCGYQRVLTPARCCRLREQSVL